ncbi:MAG: inositol monophosphatase [Candidatus Beckwithbacteria bacterium]
MSSISLSKIHQQVKKILPPVNKKLLDNFSKPQQIFYKPSRHASISVVTRLDSQIENYLKQELKKILPQAGFIGEETPIKVKEYNWIVDPIDGTFNYAQQLPDFAVSIALWHYNQPVYGLTSFPILHETIHAFNRPGIYLNQKRFQPKADLIKKPLGVYSIVSNQPSMNHIFSQFNSVIPSPRSYGCCVLHGAFTALSRIHVAVLINQAIWDIGAILLLVQAAGLSCRWLSPEPDLSKPQVDAYKHSLIIGQSELVNRLSSKIKL